MNQSMDDPAALDTGKIGNHPELFAVCGRISLHNGGRLITEHRKGSIAMEENNQKDAQEDSASVTDEELERFQKKEERKITIIGDIIEFIVNFFR